MDDLYAPELRDLIQRAYSRMRRRLKADAPTLSARALEWMASLTPEAPPETYFMHPKAFPMLLLPWWLEAGIRGAPAPAFHGDVVYSTLNGYYFVRMIDDLMDREHQPAATVLPALIFFHTEFQQSYHRYFPYGHPFWKTFAGASFASAETASKDAGLHEIDRAQFLETSARKIAGAKVPIAAVCHRYERPELLEPWSEFVDLLGRWHQMLNDMLGWSRDLDHGRKTYFLSEASCRKDPTVSVAEWVITEGVPWGLGQLEAWMPLLLETARELGSAPLVVYLEERRSALAREWESLMPSLAALGRLASALR